MTKQEEIRDWLKDLLSEYGCPDTLLDNEAGKILSYLHSQGVVIKVTQKYPLQPPIIYEPLIDKPVGGKG